MTNVLRNILLLRFVSRAWRLPCFAALGLFAGMALLLADVSRAPSYLTDSPETCVNCHVMRPHYASWAKSSHGNVATCNDCHVPHETLAGAYAFKARDGIYHSTIFTLRMEPQVIHLSSAAAPVVNGNCRRCHEQVLDAVTTSDVHSRQDRYCWDCHREVPHGSARSLSSAPLPMAPLLPSVLEHDDPRIGGRTVRPSDSEDHKGHTP